MTKIHSVGKVLLLILFSTQIYATTGPKKTHGSKRKSKHSCNCKREFTLSGGLYDSSEYVFWGKVVKREPIKVGFTHKVELQTKIKGCFKKDFIFLTSDPKCPVKLKVHTEYLIAIRKRKGKHKHILISNCSYIHKQVDDISLWAGGGISELAWLGSQMGGCKEHISCADGSDPLTCNECPRIEDIQKICPIAKRCKMNQCNGCRPQYFDENGKRVCDSCPPDQPPIPCPKELCKEAKPPASCNSESDLFCVPWGCGSCSTLWINKFGNQVCKSESISQPVVEIISGDQLECPNGQTADKCVTKNLEMYCQYVKCKGHVPKQCRADPCNKCRVELEDSTGQIIDSELCKLDLPAYRECTAYAQVTCPSTTKEKHIYIKKNLVDCYGVVPQKCMLIKQSQDGNFEYYYDTISNFTFTPGYFYELLIKEISILNPPADGSSLKWELIRILKKRKHNFFDNIQINDGDTNEHNCIGGSDDFLTWCPFKKKCLPPGEKCIDCGPIPSSCPPDWNARCVIDPCSCKPIWMNEDIRSPSDECLRSLVAKCVPEEECPMDFECLPSQVKERPDFPQGFDLQCIQEPCTCVPMWHTYDILVGPLVVPGFKEKCRDGQKCCPGDYNARDYNAKNCSQVLHYNQELCKSIVCDGVEVNQNSCTTDSCDDCNIKAYSTHEKPIAMGTCKIQTVDFKKCKYDHTFVCDPNIPLNCGSAFPPSCPKDWNIQCVLDPCVCRPYWRDMDVRYTKETCKMALEPPCIPYEECPKLPCLHMQPELKEDYECLPKPCTCQPEIVPRNSEDFLNHPSSPSGKGRGHHPSSPSGKGRGHHHSPSGKGRGHHHSPSGKGRGHAPS